MYWLSSFYWLCWVTLALAGLVFGAWYQWAKSKEEWRELVVGTESGPIQDLLRSLDEHKRHLLTTGEDLGALRNEIAGKDASLAGLERQLSGKETQLNLSTIELEKVRNHLAGRDRDISQSEKELMEAEAALGDREDQLSAIERGIAEKERLIRDLERGIAGGDGGSADAELAGLNTELKALQDRLADLEQRMTSASAAREQYERELQQAREALAAREKAREEADKRRQTAADRRKNTVVEIERNLQQLAERNDLEERWREVQALLASRTERLRDLRLQVAERDRELALLQGRISNAKAALDTAKIGPADLGEISGLRKLISDRATELSTLRKELKAGRRSIDHLDSELAELKSRHLVLEGAEGEKGQDLKDLARQLAERAAQFTLAEDKLRDVQRTLADKEQKIERLGVDPATRERRLKALREQLDQLARENSDLIELVLTTNRDADRLDSELNAASEKLAEINREIVTFTDTTNRLEDEVKEKTQAKERLDDELTQARRNEKARGDEIKTLEQKIVKLEAEQINLAKTRDEKEAEAARLADQIALIEKVQGLLQVVEDREGSLADLRTQLRKAEEEHSRANEQLTTIRTQHRRVSSLLDELLARLARVKDTLA